jgi:hypothetical protein
MKDSHTMIEPLEFMSYDRLGTFRFSLFNSIIKLSQLGLNKDSSTQLGKYYWYILEAGKRSYLGRIMTP